MTEELIQIISEWKQGRYQLTPCWSSEDVGQIVLDKKAFVLPQIEGLMLFLLGASVFFGSIGVVTVFFTSIGTSSFFLVVSVTLLGLFLYFVSRYHPNYLCVGPQGIYWKTSSSAPHFIPWKIVQYVTEGTRMRHHVRVPEVKIWLVTESILTFDYTHYSHKEIRQFPAFFALFERFNAASIHQTN